MRNMRKIRISEYDMRVVINCLHLMQQKYDIEKQYETVCVLSRVITYHKTMKPNRKKKFTFSTEDIQTVFRCLWDWRNEFITQGKDIEADAVNDVITIFA